MADYELRQDTASFGSWWVEQIDHEGHGYVERALFRGPNARERAEEYAAFKNGQSLANG